jgi:hypothetical protein
MWRLTAARKSERRWAESCGVLEVEVRVCGFWMYLGRRRIDHGSDPLCCLGAEASHYLCSAFFEPPCLRSLVCCSKLSVHLEESKLLDELSPCVGGDFVGFHVDGAIGFIVEDLGER